MKTKMFIAVLIVALSCYGFIKRIAHLVTIPFQLWVLYDVLSLGETTVRNLSVLGLIHSLFQILVPIGGILLAKRISGVVFKNLPNQFKRDFIDSPTMIWVLVRMLGLFFMFSFLDGFIVYLVTLDLGSYSESASKLSDVGLLKIGISGFLAFYLLRYGKLLYSFLLRQ